MLKRKAIIILVPVLILFTTLIANSITKNNIISTGNPVKNEIYSDAIKKIDTLIRREIKKHNIPGLSITVVDDKDVLWSEGYGFQDVENKTPATPRTLYRVGSDTKPFTATAVMILAERGLVGLDNPVTDYIPDFKINVRKSNNEVITIRHLLSHHAGIRRDIYKDYEGEKTAILGTILKELSKDYLVRAPGTRYQYSNIGYSLLGIIIERISGKSYERFMEDEIFIPLGMTSTFPSMQEVEINMLSKGYIVEGSLLKKVREIKPVECRDIPAGSIISNVEDLGRYLQFILNNGVNSSGKMILGEETLRSMFVVQYPGNVLNEDPYGLGWKVNKAIIPGNSLSIEHGGTHTGYQSLLAALPDEKLGISIIYNTNQVLSRHYIANEALKILLEEKKGYSAKENNSANIDNTVELEEAGLREMSGRYVAGTDAPMIVDISMKEKDFRIKLQGQELNLTYDKTSGKYIITKKVLFFNIGVGRFIGYDEVLLDFVKLKDKGVYPRLSFVYKNLRMTMLLERVAPYIPDAKLAQLGGRYELTEESKTHVYGESFSYVKLSLNSQWLEAEMNVNGSTYTAVLIPIKDGEFVIAGTGETVLIDNGLLKYSGLTFESSLEN